ncbi:hypothetical protein, partial [Methanothermobacter sp. K4]|uniref:hypothetical protein n=1 Tax=Methanothermobacter sp. K4 TaxID=2913262 RepID=UPI001EDAEB59
MRMLNLGELIDFFESIGAPCLDNSEMPVWDLNEPETSDDECYVEDDESYEEPMPRMMDEPDDVMDPEPDYDESDLAPEEYLMDPEYMDEYIDEEYEFYEEYIKRKKNPDEEILELLNQLEQDQPDEKEILELLNQLEQDQPDEKE